MTRETARRKEEHIRISLDRDVQARKITTGFEDVHFVHNALPEINLEDVDLTTTIFGHTLDAPLIVGALTGGTQKAAAINATIAEAVEELHLGMGVGSQRAAIEDRSLEKTFSVARKKAPEAFLVANIGGVQLVNGYSLREVKKAIEMIEADAIAVHLNPLQEAIQPEGQTNFHGILEKIARITSELERPVIVKETGAGISAGVAKSLEDAGVGGLDVSGAGGTSWAAVEYFREGKDAEKFHRRLGALLWDWGIPTAVCIVEVSRTVKIPIIGSGGIRNGLEMTKALALGASLTSLSQPSLAAAVRGLAETKKMLSLFMKEMKNIFFLLGAESVHALRETPVIITGKTEEWLRMRGFKLEDYAQRRI